MYHSPVLRALRILSVLLIISMITAQLPGESERIEQELIHYNPRIKFITNARDLIWNALEEDRFSKADSLIRFMDDRFEEEKIHWLYPSERLLIGLIKGSAESIRNVGNLTLVFDSSLRDELTFITPDDGLFSLLSRHYKEHRDKVKERILKNRLTQEEQDFFHLLDMYIMDETNEKQTAMNEKCDAFLTRYPDSAYNEIIRKNFRYKLMPTGNSVSLGMFAGYAGTGGTLGEVFPVSSSFGVNVDYTFRNWFFNLDITISDPTGLTREISSGNDVFDPDNTYNINISQMNFGHIYSFQKFMVIPFAGINFSNIEETAYKTRGIRSSFAPGYGYGIQVEIPFYGKSNVFSILKYSVIVRVGKNHLDFSDIFENDIAGDFTYAQIGFGMRTTFFKRDY